MTRDLLAAAFILGTGLCLSAACTYLYQGLARQPAVLRMDGRTTLGMFGHLLMSFICGPFIMLQMGWRHEEDGTMSMSSTLFTALIAFGWAFITGLLFMSLYVVFL